MALSITLAVLITFTPTSLMVSLTKHMRNVHMNQRLFFLLSLLKLSLNSKVFSGSFIEIENNESKEGVFLI